MVLFECRRLFERGGGLLAGEVDSVRVGEEMKQYHVLWGLTRARKRARESEEGIPSSQLPVQSTIAAWEERTPSL